MPKTARINHEFELSSFSPIPGLKVLPESSIYHVREEHVDILLTDMEGRNIRCCVVNRFTTDEMAVIDFEALAYRIQTLVWGQTEKRRLIRYVEFHQRMNLPAKKYRLTTARVSIEDTDQTFHLPAYYIKLMEDRDHAFFSVRTQKKTKTTQAPAVCFDDTYTFFSGETRYPTTD